jgi:hypothetical protein
MGISYGTPEQLHRERRKQRTHPERRMSRTHRYEMNDTVPTTTAIGSNVAARLKPWTFGFSLYVDSSKGTPIGCIFECGGVGDGFAIVLEDGRIGVAAGDGTSGNTTGGLYVETPRLFDVDDEENRVLVAVDPGRARVAVWRNGVHLELSGSSALFGEWGQYWARPSSGDFTTPGRWCGDNDGGVGAKQSTITDQPSTAAQADLVGATARRFSIYRGQLPPFRVIQ